MRTADRDIASTAVHHNVGLVWNRLDWPRGNDAFGVNGAQGGENQYHARRSADHGLGGYNDPVMIPNLEGIQSVQILHDSLQRGIRPW